MEPILSLFDFLKQFPSEKKCFQYLSAKQWPDWFFYVWIPLGEFPAYPSYQIKKS